MADISKIKINNTTYELKDSSARTLISELQAYSDYLGVTTTALSDGSTTNPIVINSKSITAKKGNIVNYGAKEFIFNGSAWQLFGDLSALGSAAYKDSLSGEYTPEGSVSQPTFSGNSLTSTGTYKPEGSVSYTGSTNRTAAVSTTSGTVTYTPAGAVTQPTFTGNSLTSTGKFTPSGSVSYTGSTNRATTVSTTSGTATYTPGGTVSTPTISLSSAGATSSVYSMTTMPSYTVSGETLTLSVGARSSVTVKTGDASYTSSQPTFTGTGVRLYTGTINVPTSFSFTGTEGDVSVTGTPTGTVSQPTFSGTGVRLVTGNISVPTSFSFSGTSKTVSVSGTPSGTVSKPIFTGTEATITVS